MKEEPGPPARWTKDTFRSRSHPTSSSPNLPTPPSLLVPCGGHSAHSGVTSSPNFPPHGRPSSCDSAETPARHSHPSPARRLATATRKTNSVCPNSAGKCRSFSSQSLCLRAQAKSSFKDGGWPALLGLTALCSSGWERLWGEDPSLLDDK